MSNVSDAGSIVELTKREIAMGAHCGVMRNITALELEPAYGFEEEHAWNVHIEGACGEVAAAKLLNIFWSPTVGTFKSADIGQDVQVRTRSRHDYDLIVRPKDDPTHIYLLMTGKAPSFVARGYLLGGAARRPEWLREHGGRPPAWFVPQHELRPWRELLERMKAP